MRQKRAGRLREWEDKSEGWGGSGIGRPRARQRSSYGVGEAKAEREGKKRERGKGKKRGRGNGKRGGKGRGAGGRGRNLPSGASGCAALQQSAKPKESTEKLRWRSSGAKPKTGSSTSRNGLAGGDNLESCPRVFTVNIFRAPGNSGERRRMHSPKLDTLISIMQTTAPVK